MRPQIFDMLFHDDRMFVLELSPVETRTGNEPSKNEWSVITRRNVTGYPPYRSDTFPTRADALDYYKKVVVSTTLVSLGGKPISSQLTIEEYQRWLIAKNLYDPILNPSAPVNNTA
jgi:hypothetical protein